MPPIIKFSRGEIIDAAFSIAKDEGFQAITARRVAKQLGCSVTPIYINFETINDLVDSVVQRAFSISQNILDKQDGASVWDKVGRASLEFARRYPVFLRELMLQPNPHIAAYEVVEEKILAELAQDKQLGDWTDTERRRLFFTMRVVQTGLAVLVANGHVPTWLDEEGIDQLLMELGADLVRLQEAKRGRASWPDTPT